MSDTGEMRVLCEICVMCIMSDMCITSIVGVISGLNVIHVSTGSMLISVIVSIV